MNRAYVLLVLAIVILSVTACRRRRAAVEGSSVVIGVETAGAEGQCTANLTVSEVVAQPGCRIDQRVSGQSTVLTYPCAGGQAQATFIDTVFTGSVSNGAVDVAIETSFPFQDGCTWRSKQRISGVLGSGALAYEYEESPEPGQSGCSNGCTATATVQVQ